MALSISSTAFREGEHIPAKHTCCGQDVSPTLTWSGAPVQTKSLVLILEDPDAPRGLFTHWVIFNLPAVSHGLPEGVPGQGELADGTLQGRNDGGSLGYMGPCPPPGKPHRYYFKLYALDQPLSLKAGASRKQVLDTMQGHVLAEAQLMGLFEVKGWGA